MTLSVTFDEKRWGYHVASGDDWFFAYFTGEAGSPDSWIEFDLDKWRGEDLDMHFQIPIGATRRPSTDLIETLIANAFHAYGVST